MEDIKIGCVVLNYNDYLITQNLVKKIKNFESIFKIVIVDNFSTDNSYNELKKMHDNKVDVISTEKNNGYGTGNNRGVEYLFNKYSIDYVLIANPDVEFEETLIMEFINVFRKERECVMVSAIQKLPNGKEGSSYWKALSKYETILSGELIFDICLKKKYKMQIKEFNKQYIEVDCVAGSLVLIDANWFIENHGYDEDVFLYMEESFLAKKVKLSCKKTFCLLNSSYLHQHGYTISKYNSLLKKRKILCDSTKIYFKRFYNDNIVSLLLISLFFFIGNIELSIVKWIKNIFK